ncbi:MAG TPA: galactose-1-phosphate uridylyltransferase, partial [Clostridiales bacterium]|nr:galactose-1-phosphate uridylyltransferase [Clostridiales bacterium]
NNMTSEQYPDGIYHAHPEYHNIKKEGIGLIEAMGLFILPGRLKKQLAMIQEMLVKRDTYNYEELCNPENYLYVHRDMIKSLVEKNPSVSSMEKAEKITTDYINNVCKNILLNTSVYTKDEKGMLALGNFLKTLNIK